MVSYEVAEAVARITIDDEARRNPMSNEVMALLATRVREASEDGAVRVIVITGAGDRAFSAGGDLSGGFVDDPIPDHGARRALADLLRAVRESPKPVVARVNGSALGGGFGLAVACDITIAADDAKLGAPEVNLGLWPMMISAVLLRAMPTKALVEMMMTGRVVTGEEAEQLGLVTRAVERSSLDEEVDAVVAALVAKSPAALALGKRAVAAVSDLDFDSALDHLHIGLTAISLTDDAGEGVRAFLDKRDPEWRGR